MNKLEKKIDLLLRVWLSDRDDLSDRAIETEKRLIKEIQQILNPKEDVPYAESLFVKSSKGEGE